MKENSAAVVSEEVSIEPRQTQDVEISNGSPTDHRTDPSLEEIFLLNQNCLRFITITATETMLEATVSTANPSTWCPCCGKPSPRVHSRYLRHPYDLPVVGRGFRLLMNVRRFFCDNDQCERKIFTERLPEVIEPYSRHTRRLIEVQTEVAFESGGEPGSRQLKKMGMSVSGDALLRRIRRCPEQELPTPRILGVDDWAKQKGQSYGTILVNHEDHRVVDLLPERTSVLFKEWLEMHPGVETISGDRGGEYRKGATEGAPNAVQVADRWQVVENLRESVEEFFKTDGSCLTAVDVRSPPEDAAAGTTESTGGRSDAELEGEPTTIPLEQPSEPLAENKTGSSTDGGRPAERNKRVLELHAQGMSIRAISRRLNLTRNTVRRHIGRGPHPCAARPSKLDPYIEHLMRRWNEGCLNASTLYGEIRKQGFAGSLKTVSRWATRRRKEDRVRSSDAFKPATVNGKIQKPASLSPSNASWLFIQNKEELPSDKRTILDRLLQADERAKQAYSFAQDFLSMMREKLPGGLNAWLDGVLKSGIAGLTSFARGVSQDLEAVKNAFRSPWSNGLTEGHVNRLKTIKRRMYGRAKLDLLRKVVLRRTPKMQTQ